MRQCVQYIESVTIVITFISPHMYIYVESDVHSPLACMVGGGGGGGGGEGGREREGGYGQNVYTVSHNEGNLHCETYPNLVSVVVVCVYVCVCLQVCECVRVCLGLCV